MTWAVEFYEEDDGSAPVEAFLAQLPREHRAKALAIVKRLEEAGPTLPFPYSSRVKEKIRELQGTVWKGQNPHPVFCRQAEALHSAPCFPQENGKVERDRHRDCRAKDEKA